MCSCQLDQFLGVDVCCQVWTLFKAFRKWNGFGDDVIAEQPSHQCLVVHNTVCHVTPCVFLSSESWLKHGRLNDLWENDFFQFHGSGFVGTGALFHGRLGISLFTKLSLMSM